MNTQLRIPVVALAMTLLAIGFLFVQSPSQASEAPCQVWIDTLEIHKARQAANSSYPQHFIDRAQASFLDCAKRNTDTYWPSGPGVGTRKDGEPHRPTQPTSRQARSYTYSPAEAPDPGWRDSTSPRNGCNWNPLGGESLTEWRVRCVTGTFHMQFANSPSTAQERTERAEKQAEEESRAGGGNFYRRPHGGGANGAIRVPCDASGNKLARDADENWVGSGRPPAGQVCY